MFPGTFAPWNESFRSESSREHSFLGTFAPRSKNTGEQKVPEPCVFMGNLKDVLECSYLEARPMRQLDCWNFVGTSVKTQGHVDHEHLAPWLVQKPAERVVDPNFKLVFSKSILQKVNQICNRVRASSALSRSPWRIAEKIVVDAEGLESGFPSGVRCSNTVG